MIRNTLILDPGPGVKKATDPRSAKLTVSGARPSIDCGGVGEMIVVPFLLPQSSPPYLALIVVGLVR